MMRSMLEVAMASLWLAAVYSDVARDVTRTWMERIRNGSRTFIEQTVVPKVRSGIEGLVAAARESRDASSKRRACQNLTTSPRG